VWQSIYEELNDPNFVIISAAQDTGGEQVAGPIFDAANVSYVQIVDVNHVISSAFNFVNVPSAAWVDEAGQIVHIGEGTYAKTYPFGGTDAYAPAVKDWVRKGADSQYVKKAATIANDMRKRTPAQEQAESAFRLGNFFREKGHADKAEHYWERARASDPDNVNFFRQDLTLSEEGSAGERFLKFRSDFQEAGKDYYGPLGVE